MILTLNFQYQILMDLLYCRKKMHWKIGGHFAIGINVLRETIQHLWEDHSNVYEDSIAIHWPGIQDDSLDWLLTVWRYPDSQVHGANMGPTWVLSAPDGPHVSPINLAIRVTVQLSWGGTVTVVFNPWWFLKSRHYHSPNSTLPVASKTCKL